MNVKCFKGRSISEVMKLIQKEFGDDAVILHTQNTKPLLSWFSKKPLVKVWAAIPDKSHQENHTSFPSPSQQPSNLKMNQTERSNGIPKLDEPSPPWSEITFRLERQLQALASMLWSGEGASFSASALSLLWRCGVDLGTARAILQNEKDQYDDDYDLNQRLHNLLCKHFLVTYGIRPETKVAVLVGPTGVGKTTTVAKITALELLNRRRRVGILTVDVFRIGAVQQLETYARLMGLPFFVATVAEEASRCVASALKVADLVLVDTIGRNPRQHEQLSQLQELVSAIRPDEVYLTLPANGNFSDMLLASNRFAIFSPTSFLFTKMDETSQPGVIVSLTHRLKLPVSYITIGQNVPDDIEVATPQILTKWVLSPIEDREGAVSHA